METPDGPYPGSPKPTGNVKVTVVVPDHIQKLIDHMSSMSACACMGPPGDCPCIRRSRGLPVPIPEAYIAPDVWEQYMTDEEKNTINRIKMEAAMRSIFQKRNTQKAEQNGIR